MKTPYKYQVNFEKTFTDGILKGHHYSMNHVRFAEKANAIVFVELCDGKTEREDVCSTTTKAIWSHPILINLKDFE